MSGSETACYVYGIIFDIHILDCFSQATFLHPYNDELCTVVFWLCTDMCLYDLQKDTVHDQEQGAG